MRFYLCSHWESEEANYFTHNYVCFNFVKKEEKPPRKSTKNTPFPQSLTFCGLRLEDGKKKEVSEVFQKALLLFFFL